MLTVLGNQRRLCNGYTRRELLQVGGAGLFGVTLPRVLKAERSQNPVRAKSVLFVYLFGGPSQLETFDMKPDAPKEIRGTFNPIQTKTPGIHICEHLPLLARQSDKWALVRSKWDEVYGRNQDLVLEEKVDNKVLYKYLFGEGYEEEAQIDSIIESFVKK